MTSRYSLMICFVGEQPIANLIPIKHLKPEKVILCVTDRTVNVGNNLKNAIGEKISIEKVDPYKINKTIDSLMDIVNRERNEADIPMIAFNLTGGTKPMVFAGFVVCQKYKSPFYYLQSEGGKNILYAYHWENSELMPPMKGEQVRDNISLDEYVRVHTGCEPTKKKTKKHNKYEELVYSVLKDQVDEILNNIYLAGSLEVDLMFRIGNQVSIAEIKTKGAATKKRGIDQLNTAGGREYLGTYTKKFFIIDRECPQNNKALAEERNIIVIELKNSENVEGLQSLNAKDRDLLIETIRKEVRS